MGRVFRFFGVVLGLCLLVGPAWSQSSYGKLTGTVTDAKVETLPGANVVLEGTRFGATTDAEGVYVILGIEPGVYAVKVSIVGYESMVQQKVQVAAGRTSTANFTLRESAIEAAEIVVTAERPLIEMDRTGSETKLSEQAIEQTPILRDTKQHLEFVAGVDPVSKGVDRGRGYRSSNGVRIRRQFGQLADQWQSWTLDGIELTILDNGYQNFHRQYTNIPVTSIAEMAVVKGGISVAHVSTLSGVVNIVSREGGRNYHGGLDVWIEPPGKRHRGSNVYDATVGQRGGTNGLWQDKLRWNDPDWVNEVDPVSGQQIHVKQDYEGAVGHLVEGWFSGPLGKNSTFIVSGKTARAKEIFPAPTRVGLRQWSVFGKLAYTPADNLKLKLGYNQSSEPRYQGDLRGPNTNLFLVRGHTGYEQQWRNLVLYTTATHTLSPKAFHEFQVGFYRTSIDTTKDTDKTASSWRSDELGKFRVDRQFRQIRTDYNRRYQFRYDLTGQVTRRNLFKTGLSYQVFRNYTYQYDQRSASAGTIYMIAEDSKINKRYTANRLALYAEDKIEFQGLIVNVGLRYEVLWGGPRRPMSGFLRSLPSNGTYNAYQTRIPLGRAKPMVTWQPRVALSHPLTDRAVVRYSIGQYSKPSMFGQIWGETWETKRLKDHPELDGTWGSGRSPNGGGWRLDSAFHDPGGFSRMTEFEVSGEWNFVSDFVLDAAVYYRRLAGTNSLIFRRFWDPVRRLVNDSRGQGPQGRFESRAIELSIYKPFSRNFSFRVSLDVGWAFNLTTATGKWPRLIYFYPDSTFIASEYYFFVDENDNPVPLTDAQIRDIGSRANKVLRARMNTQQNQTAKQNRFYYSDYLPYRDALPHLTEEEKNLPWHQGIWATEGYWPDKRPRYTPPPVAQATFQFLWSTPSDWGPGPTVGGSRILGGIQANLVWRFDSGNGIRFTPPGASWWGAKSGPMFVRTDLNFQKTFNTEKFRHTVYVEVFNLFNSYVDRGSEHPGEAYIRWGLFGPVPSDAKYQKYGDPLPFRGGTPRYVNAGVRIRF